MARQWKRYGTKRYAMAAMRDLMRRWAKAKRRGSILDHSGEVATRFGEVLGARGALQAVGALTQAQYDKLDRRIDRIIGAKITRAR